MLFPMVPVVVVPFMEAPLVVVAFDVLVLDIDEDALQNSSQYHERALKVVFSVR